MPPGGSARVRAVCAEPCAGCLLPLLVRSSELAGRANRPSRRAGRSPRSEWSSRIHGDVFSQLRPGRVDDRDRHRQATVRRFPLHRCTGLRERKGRVSTMGLALPPPGQHRAPAAGEGRPWPTPGPTTRHRMTTNRWRRAPDPPDTAGGDTGTTRAAGGGPPHQDRGRAALERPCRGRWQGPARRSPRPGVPDRVVRPGGRAGSDGRTSPVRSAVYRGHMVVSRALARRWY